MLKSVMKLHYPFVTYALYMCGVLALCLILMEITGQNESFDNKSPLTIVFMFLAPLVIWYFGIRGKKRSLKGKMTFKQGLSEGFKISLTYGLLSPFIFLAYYLFINPGILEYVRTAYGLTDAPAIVVYGADMFAQFVSAVVFGSLYGAIISFFLKTKEK